MSIVALTFLFASIAVAQPTTAPPTTVPATPQTLEGAESFIYRDLQPDPLRLHVFKPKGWTTKDHRPALVYFFGGAWQRGTPDKSAAWARQAARWGMVGVAPDYRTHERFGTTPLESIADARASVRWVQDHAAELGIDPAKVIVGGNSAGGHLALWCAITTPPDGVDPKDSLVTKPVALLLFSAASDTTSPLGVKYMGARAKELSPIHHLDAKMPPTLMFHGDADKTVPYPQPVALNDALNKSGNTSELITIPGGSHGFTTDFPEWKDKSRAKVQEFLTQQGLILANQK